MIPDGGEIFLEGQQAHFRNPMDARAAGIETVYQTLAVAPGLDIAAHGRRTSLAAPAAMAA
jgi:fructose transport system ATP-binding protein